MRLTFILRLATLLCVMLASLLSSSPVRAVVASSQASMQTSTIRSVEPAAQSCAGPIPGTGKISGNVKTADTNNGFASVSVVAYTSDGLVASSVQTDASGNYTLNKLASGSYIVGFFPPEYIFVLPGGIEEVPYISKYYNNQRSYAAAHRVTVTEPQTTTHIDAKLERGAEISGTITSSDAPVHGLAGIGVVAYDAQGNPYRSSTTKSDGTYTITRLPAGNYKIGIEPPTYGAPINYLKEYYNDKLDLASAASIPLTLGSSATINASLQTGGQIAGKVTGTNGAALQNVGIAVYDSNDTQVESRLTAADGTYTTNGLRPGAYRIKADPASSTANRTYVAEYYNDKSDPASATPVIVTKNTTTPNINVQLASGAYISGKVTGTAGVALGNVTVRTYDSKGFVVSLVGTANDGTYATSTLQPGNYRLEFLPPGSGATSAYAPEFYNDTPDLASATPVVVTKGTRTPNINVQMEPGARIAGKVTAQTAGAPIGDVQITVYDNSGTFIGSARTASDGTYLTSGLRTGVYRLVFDPSRFQTPAYAREYYNDKPNIEQATPIQVTGQQVTSNINAQLAPGGCIYGQVTAADTSEPLSGVFVTLYDSAGDYITNVSTDTIGAYKIVGLATGDYTIEFEVPSSGILSHYVSEYYNNKPGQGSVDTIKVSAPNATPAINATLERGGLINGRVTGTNGNGVENVMVRFFDSDGNSKLSWTNAKGEYSSVALRSGTYKVGFTPLVPSALLAAEYYNDKPDLASANTVSVTAATTTSGINATLGPASTLPKRMVYLPLTRK